MDRTGLAVKKTYIVVGIVVALVFIACGLVGIIFFGVKSDRQKFITKPVLNQGRKWRVGCYAAGSYLNYPIFLKEFVGSMKELGWISELSLPVSDAKEEAGDTKRIWAYLARHTRSDHLEFVADAYWCAEYDHDLRKKVKEDVIAALQQKQVDILISIGTWAGQDVANDRHRVPVVVTCVSDPIKSKIIKSAKDSGYDHINAKVDPGRYRRQLITFHNIVGFKKLGIAFEDSVAGRTFAAISVAEELAAERGFEIVKCDTPVTGVDNETCMQKMIACHETLVKSGVDAVYLTVHRGIQKESLPQILKILSDFRIPSFAMRGTMEVETGALFGLAGDSLKPDAMFQAKVMATILNGVKPRAIPQVFEEPKNLVINKKTAELIGFEVPSNLWVLAHKVYTTVDF